MRTSVVPHVVSGSFAFGVRLQPSGVVGSTVGLRRPPIFCATASVPRDPAATAAPLKKFRRFERRPIFSGGPSASAFTVTSSSVTRGGGSVPIGGALIPALPRTAREDCLALDETAD